MTYDPRVLDYDIQVKELPIVEPLGFTSETICGDVCLYA